MSVTAKEFKGFMDEIGLKYKDQGIDRDGDHIFVLGLPAKGYVDFDGAENFMVTLQLREHVEGTGQDEEKIKELVNQLLNTEDQDKVMELKKEITLCKGNDSEREYEMVVGYIPRLNFRSLKRDAILEIINSVNAQVKCSSLSIDESNDVTYNYMFILEDGAMTLKQFKRLLSVIHSSVSEFGKRVAQSLS